MHMSEDSLHVPKTKHRLSGASGSCCWPVCSSCLMQLYGDVLLCAVSLRSQPPESELLSSLNAGICWPAVCGQRVTSSPQRWCETQLEVELVLSGRVVLSGQRLRVLAPLLT